MLMCCSAFKPFELPFELNLHLLGLESFPADVVSLKPEYNPALLWPRVMKSFGSLVTLQPIGKYTDLSDLQWSNLMTGIRESLTFLVLTDLVTGLLLAYIEFSASGTLPKTLYIDFRLPPSLIFSSFSARLLCSARSENRFICFWTE